MTNIYKISSEPIFIYGCDRSGTTMLGDRIGTGENTFVTPESQFIHKFMKNELYDYFPKSDELYDDILNDFRFKTWNIQLNFQEFNKHYKEGGYKKVTEYILSQYLLNSSEDIASSDVNYRWVDHTPSNMEYIAIQKKWWPNAKYIHIVRDGRAVYNSIKLLDWGPNNSFFAARFWAEKELYALKMDTYLKEDVMQIKYEDLILYPKDILIKVCTFLDLDYNDSFLQGGALRLPEFTKKIHSLVGSELQTNRINAWKGKLSSSELEIFCSNLDARNLLRFYNYEECQNITHITLFKNVFFTLHQLFYGLLHRYKKQQEKRY